MEFIKRLYENVNKYPNREVFALNNREESLTYAEMWERSGRVYQYLHDRKIGPEEIVQILLPRGKEVLISMVGVLRSGAAFVIEEMSDPDERIAFVREDCSCKITINTETFDEMMVQKSRQGIDERTLHNACFVIYTSGTTGRPKGVLHEYGRLERIISDTCTAEELADTEPCRFLFLSSVNYLLFVVFSVMVLSKGGCFYLPSSETRYNLEKINGIIKENQLTHAFIPTSLLRENKLAVNKLKRAYLGGEPADGIFVEGPELINIYGTSEQGGVAAMFRLKQAYKKAPAGKNLGGAPCFILDEDGNEQPNGCIGEICVQNDYTRGYLNAPELTEKIFSKGIYHTGDMGFIDSDGLLFVCGRKDEVVNINGNRINLTEVESVIKEVLHVSKAVVKVVKRNGKEFISAYCLEEEVGKLFEVTPLGIIQDRFRKILPFHMIPAFFTALKAFPYNENRKIVRRNLPNIVPVQKEISPKKVNSDIPEENEILQVMSELLGIETLGAEEDFFEYGLDSIMIMDFLSRLDVYDLRFKDVYECRNAKNLAVKCKEKSHGKKKEDQLITDAKKYIRNKVASDYAKYLREGTVDSFYSGCFARKKTYEKAREIDSVIEIRLEHEVDSVLLQEAVSEAADRFPYVLFDIELLGTKPYVRFHKNNRPLPIHKIGEIGEYGASANNGHYTLVSYEGNILQFSISHLITDATGTFRFINQVLQNYMKVQDGNDFENHSDFTADVMSFKLPVPDDYTPEAQNESNGFRMREHEKADAAELSCYDVWMDAKSFFTYCENKKISPQLALVYLTARAIQNGNPNNKKEIEIRLPVDSRAFLGIEHSFQNASIPHIFLKLRPEELINKGEEYSLNQLQEQFEKQYCYDYIADYTNMVARFVQSESEEEILAIVSKMQKQTDVFVSYLGDILDEKVNREIRKMELKIHSSYPFMIYAYQCNDHMVFRFVQQFHSDLYVNQMIELCEEIGNL